MSKELLGVKIENSKSN